MNTDYSKYYNEKSLWQKIKKYSRAAGSKVIYGVLLLYYTMNEKSVGLKTKIYIAASLGYFILPTDAIFDLTPIIGYSDDLGVLIFALTQIASAITPEAKVKSRAKISEWFDSVDEKELKELEDQISK